MSGTPHPEWWEEAVLYQVYVRSFADSDGDGVGDLPGVASRLDHLADLGVDAIWLSPIGVSPDADWGYDAAHYTQVQPVLGSLADVDDLVAAAAERHIRVMLDLVPNHTSDEHPWFADARSARTSAHRDWYVWADPAPDGGPPNNWLSNFGGPAWTPDEATGQYYLHNFLPSQPDLNWWSADVRDAFDEILRFWFDRGIAGFRIDVCHMIVKDRELRDNPPATDDDHPFVRLLGQRQVYNSCRPELHDVLRRWRSVAEAYEPARLLLGETYVLDLDQMCSFYGAGDELHLAMNFPFLHGPFEASRLRKEVEATEAGLPEGAWPAWFGSNHDAGRLATRWCEDDEARIRCALLLLLTLRGTAILYNGDEIGLANAVVPRERIVDPVGIRFWPAHKGRDPGRTPIPWRPGPGAGFCPPAVEPWLPFGGLDRTVEAQRAAADSTLAFCRDAVRLRRLLGRAPYESLPAPEGVWAYARGDATVCVNLSANPVVVHGVGGAVRLATVRSRKGERATGGVELGAWEGLVLT